MSWGPLPDDTPTKFGLLLYDQWELLDVAGPIECLNQLARGVDGGINLSIITSQKGHDPFTMPFKVCNQQLRTEYDVTNAPSDLDVLIVPGGWGPSEKAERAGVVNFITAFWESIKGQKNKYIVTVCTGSGLAAEANVLDGLPATTNKMAWGGITPAHNKTYWVAEARYIKTEQIWTTSGVSAGTDGFLAWMNDVYGSDLTNHVINMMEYEVHGAWDQDPFGQNLVKKEKKEKGSGITDVKDTGNAEPVAWPEGFPQPEPIKRTWP